MNSDKQGEVRPPPCLSFPACKVRWGDCMVSGSLSKVSWSHSPASCGDTCCLPTHSGAKEGSPPEQLPRLPPHAGFPRDVCPFGCVGTAE